MDLNKNTAIGLLKFLKEFSELRSKKILTVDQFESVIYFSDIPQEKECNMITRHIDQDQQNQKNINYDKWIEVKKPKNIEPPHPPSTITDWIKHQDLNSYHQDLKLFPYIIQESLGVNAEVFTEKVFIEDNPKVQQAFDMYYQQKWLPWAEEKRRIEPVQKLYNQLYNIYNKYKNLSENYQIVLGLGLLSTSSSNSKNQSQYIKRHIVTTPALVEFHIQTGTITIKPKEDMELSLEQEMLDLKEIPDVSDKIDKQLSEIGNNFWSNDAFYNCLKSWIHSYDSEAQFCQNINQLNTEYKQFFLEPAIIFRKRGMRSFAQFCKDTIKHLESETSITSEKSEYSLLEDNMNKEVFDKEKPKYYFPLPVNQEQESIINKLSYGKNVIVQGPPGTGKTHSIVNLICHLLTTGKKVLVTSQTDRALKVLKRKLPDQVKDLCVEVLGQDQKAFTELKKSVNTINSKYQEWKLSQAEEKIKYLEKRDKDLNGQKIEIERELKGFQSFEKRQHEKIFGLYSGLSGDIASQLREEKDCFSWITDMFDLSDASPQKAPLSNQEAIELYKLLQSLKQVPKAYIKEPLHFSKDILNPSEFKDKVKFEFQAIQDIKNSGLDKNVIEHSTYNTLSDKDADEMMSFLERIISSERLFCPENPDSWVRQAANDCLLDKDRAWRYIFEGTQEILNEHKDKFIEKSVINIPPQETLKTIRNHLGTFFSKYKPEDQIIWKQKWFHFRPKEIKILRQVSIDDHKIRSYEDVIKLNDRLEARIASQKLNKLWANKISSLDTSSDLGNNYHYFKDLCEPLEECLKIHKSVEGIKSILSKYKIKQPQWHLQNLKKELQIIKSVCANRQKANIESQFENLTLQLKPFENQKNQMAYQMIQCICNRDCDSYNRVYDNLKDIIIYQENFQKVHSLKKKIGDHPFPKNIQDTIDNPMWPKQLEYFEEAWAWLKTKEWLEKNTNVDFIKQKNKNRKYIIEDIQKNFEELISEKAWYFCLSNMTDQEQEALRGWSYAVSKIGKGTGKTANKHRNIARQKMTKCKNAIPAWIMPLYRVVENIKPGSEKFDVAIIDEASQTGPDGFLLNFLAKQIIVVGDNEQISPEMIGIKDEDVEILKENYISDMPLVEHIGISYSYYDYCDIQFRNHIQLREHFRCMPEIIHFSNQISYSGKPLIPMRQYGVNRLKPLKHTFVEGAVSQTNSGRSPQNEKEAEELVLQLKKCMDDPSYNEKTFGIISLQGRRQIKCIENILDKEIEKTTIEKRDIRVGDAYDFQGDERDVIFLSMVVSKDYNFNALTKDTYKKRYNVAVSRAKDQVWLFHSIKIDELSPHCFRKQLLDHFISDHNHQTGWPIAKIQKLRQREAETKDKRSNRPPHPFDSWFEVNVFLKIIDKGFQVIPQYEIGDYKIDMVIIGQKGQLAIECDGDFYHHEGNKADDQQRQWKLERCGWTFWRLKYSRFQWDKDKSLEELWETLKQMNINPKIGSWA